MSLSEEVCELIAEENGASVSPQDTFEELCLDSLDFVHLLLSVENKFGVRIPPDAAGKMDKVSDIVEYLLSAWAPNA